MRLHSQLRPPARLTAETDPASGDADSEFIEALEDEDFEASLRPCDHAPAALGAAAARARRSRYSGGFGVQHLTREAAQENWPRVLADSQKLLLLLQIDLHDYLQQGYVEGTVYFLIHRNDLAARAFDKVIAVYQQP